MWTSADGSEVVVIGSVAELEERAGLPKGSVADLHRQHVDQIEIPSSRPGNAPLRRVEDVFDCWFESGSMPYAQAHYPFAFPGGERGDGSPGSEAAEAFLGSRFPADFVAEGLDQTRGWFYTLMVLSTALFDGAPAFRNLVCNGLVLASDGKKMSKRLKNYPVRVFFFHFFPIFFLNLFLSLFARRRRRRRELKKKKKTHLPSSSPSPISNNNN